MVHSVMVMELCKMDGSCDCDGIQLAVEDCIGVCGGTAVVDECGVCDTDPDNNNTTCVQDCALYGVEQQR